MDSSSLMDAAVSSAVRSHPLLNRLLSRLRLKSEVPLRLALWNGFEHDLGPEPRVTVRLGGPAALRYFLPPSLDNLADSGCPRRIERPREGSRRCVLPCRCACERPRVPKGVLR
ncbi:MAG: hypothetical protein WCH44_04090, partial [Betaproteobacteria bacterium]